MDSLSHSNIETSLWNYSVNLETDERINTLKPAKTSSILGLSNIIKSKLLNDYSIHEAYKLIQSMSADVLIQTQNLLQKLQSNHHGKVNQLKCGIERIENHCD